MLTLVNRVSVKCSSNALRYRAVAFVSGASRSQRRAGSVRVMLNVPVSPADAAEGAGGEQVS